MTIREIFVIFTEIFNKLRKLPLIFYIQRINDTRLAVIPQLPDNTPIDVKVRIKGDDERSVRFKISIHSAVDILKPFEIIIKAVEI